MVEINERTSAKLLDRYARVRGKTVSAVASAPRVVATSGLPLFAYLQLLDFLTTLIGFKHGGSELSPLVRLFLNYSPTNGVIIAKICVVLIIGVFYSRRPRIMRSLNCLFASIVVWNLGIMLWGL
jgi:hypothetical protein